ncbi:Tryptophanase [Colletotrichum sp. SAR 10_99]|nr:Tryptophanase [Colletotrichum sp. SAR 10_99]
MISHRFSTLLFLLVSLATLIFAVPVRPFAGNSAYAVDAEENKEEGRWGFSVYADGYTAKDANGKVLPVDTLMVNTVSKRLTVMKAMNGDDKTDPRLKMRQVLKACWEMTGLKPSELKTVMGWKISNTNMQEALASCRTDLKLKTADSFTITSTETEPARKTCWETLGKTIFSSAIQGAIKDFDINKELLELEVDHGDGWDHLYYRFSAPDEQILPILIMSPLIAPSHNTLVVRPHIAITPEEREEVLHSVEYNVFAFPAALLTCDYLSDSGTSAMTDVQWAAMLRGDESYGRNSGYYCLHEAFRDVFERGEDRRSVFKDVLAGTADSTFYREIFLKEICGGFVNGGPLQLIRPNFFILPQGRCAEALLFSTLSDTLCNIDTDPRNVSNLPALISNGFFDTTGANAAAAGFQLHTFTQPGLTDPSQPNSLPLFFDACRFAENAKFIQDFEAGYQDRSIPQIVQEMFAYADGFTISLKKDGLANMGGALCFRDQGIFPIRFGADIGIRLKERQIMCYGNDSYGGMSGRDVMAAAVGLYEVTKETYLADRIGQVKKFAEGLIAKGVPVLLPPGGHAIYLDMDGFFADCGRSYGEFASVDFTLELLKDYGIRACEAGPFGWEWDKKESITQDRDNIPNLVRFAVPRSTKDAIVSLE